MKNYRYFVHVSTDEGSTIIESVENGILIPCIMNTQGKFEIVFFDTFKMGKETCEHWNSTDFQQNLLFQKITSQITFFHPDHIPVEIFAHLPEEEKEKAKMVMREFLGRKMHITEDRLHPRYLELLINTG